MAYTTVYTNEELAIMVKDGDADALIQLWNQTYGLSYSLVMRYVKTAHKFGIEPEDLMQEAFFGLLNAIKSYKPDKEFPFAAYLSYTVRTAARQAIGLTRKQLDIISLDDILPGTDSYTRSETLSDNLAEQEVNEKVISVYHEQLRQSLESCFCRLKPIEAQILRSRYFEHKTIAEVAREYDVSQSYIYRREEAAIQKLSHPAVTKKLRFFLNAYIYAP